MIFAQSCGEPEKSFDLCTRRVLLKPRSRVLRFWKATVGLTGNWLMRGRFPVVNPTGPSTEGSASSEPSFFRLRPTARQRALQLATNC